MNPRGTYRNALVETTAATAKKTCVPDAVQRLFGGAPESRDLYVDPGSAAHHAAKGGVLRGIRGTRLCGAPNRNHPLAAPTFENRLRMRNDSSSQTSR